MIVRLLGRQLVERQRVALASVSTSAAEQVAHCAIRISHFAFRISPRPHTERQLLLLATRWPDSRCSLQLARVRHQRAAARESRGSAQLVRRLDEEVNKTSALCARHSLCGPILYAAWPPAVRLVRRRLATEGEPRASSPFGPHTADRDKLAGWLLTNGGEGEGDGPRA